MQRRAFNHALLAMAALVGGVAGAAEEPWPTRPIKVILPFSAGGTGDSVARALAVEMDRQLGQPLVMENRVGGTGILGQDVAMRSAPDGYTMVAISISGALAYHFHDRDIDFTKDFAMVGQVYSQYAAVVINPSIPELSDIQNLRDLIEYAKRKPGTINYASQGSGSIGHLTMERVKQITGIDVVHVPYRGAAPAYTDLMAGHIQMMSTSLGALPYIRAGKMRALGMAGSARSPLLPECPTFKEQGVDLVAGSWYGFAMPAETPAPIIQRMAQELKLAVEKPQIAEILRGQGVEPEFLPGPEFAAIANTDFRKWGEVIRERGIKLE